MVSHDLCLVGAERDEREATVEGAEDLVEWRRRGPASVRCQASVAGIIEESRAQRSAERLKEREGRSNVNALEVALEDDERRPAQRLEKLRVDLAHGLILVSGRPVVALDRAVSELGRERDRQAESARIEMSLEALGQGNEGGGVGRGDRREDGRGVAEGLDDPSEKRGRCDESRDARQGPMSQAVAER